MDWLEEQVIDVIHTDAGRYIDVRGNAVRKKIDEEMARSEQGEKP